MIHAILLMTCSNDARATALSMCLLLTEYIAAEADVGPSQTLTCCAEVSSDPEPQILASIGQLEFFYDQAPDVMRSCSMALQLLSVAIGSYLSGALVYVVGAYTTGLAGAKHGWLPNDLNKGRVDLFFLLLGGASTPH